MPVLFIPLWWGVGLLFGATTVGVGATALGVYLFSGKGRKDAMQQLRSLLEAKTTEINQLNEQCRTLNAQISELTRAIPVSAQNVQASAARVNESALEVSDSVQELQKTAFEVEFLKNQIATEELPELQAMLELMSNVPKEALDALNERAVKKIVEIKTTIESFSGLAADLKKQINSLNKKVNGQPESPGGLKQQINELRLEIKEKNNKINARGAIINAQFFKIQEREQVIQEQAKEIKLLKQQLENISMRLAQVSSSLVADDDKNDKDNQNNRLRMH